MLGRKLLAGATVATTALCLLLAVAMDKTPPAVLLLAKTKGLACGRGGPCPAGPAFIRKAGLTSAAEVAWSKSFPVENAADKAPTVKLLELTAPTSYIQQPKTNPHHYLDFPSSSNTQQLAGRKTHYLDDDTGGAAGKSYAQRPKGNPHHYLDFPSSSNSREPQIKGSITSLSEKEPRFGGEGNLNTHPVPTHGKEYVQLPKSNPHHYADFPSSSNVPHVERHYADEPSSPSSRRPQKHYMDEPSSPNARHNMGSVHAEIMDKANLILQKPKGALKDLKAKDDASFLMAKNDLMAKIVKEKHAIAMRQDMVGKAQEKHARAMQEMMQKKMQLQKEKAEFEKQMRIARQKRTPSNSNRNSIAKGTLTSLSGLQSQPAAPFGGQTFGHTQSKAKLISLSGLQSQPAAPFGGQTFGRTK